MTESIKSIVDLKFDPNNANLGTDRGRKLLAESLEKYGAGRSIVCDRNGVVIGGNKTLEAAVNLGLDIATVKTSGDKLVVVIRDDLDLEANPKARELAYYDNRVAEVDLQWNVEQLQIDLSNGIDLGSLWAIDELSSLQVTAPPDDEKPAVDDSTPSEIPNDEEIPSRVKRGEVWQIGNHLVMCGDCRNCVDVGRLLGTTPVNVVMTSPPYASQRKYDEESGFKPIPSDEYVNWFDAVQSNIKKYLAKDGSFFLNIKESCGDDGQRLTYCKDLLMTHIREWRWLWIEEFCWLRNAVPKQVVKHFKNGYEPIYQLTLSKNFKFNPDDVRHETDNYLVPIGEGAGNTNWSEVQGHGNALDPHGIGRECVPGMAYPSNVLDFAKGGGGVKGHTAVYPVALPEFFIKAFSDECDRIFDPFGGSGTTAVAAHKNNRKALLMEISEKYCDLILVRMERETGKIAQKL